MPKQIYDLPANLTYDKNSNRYRYRCPSSGKRTWIGADKSEAIAYANFHGHRSHVECPLPYRPDLLVRQGEQSESCCALYRHYGVNFNLLYVGISVSLLNRTSNHSNVSDWFQSVAHIAIEWYRNRDAALSVEKMAIFCERPKHNKKLDNFSVEEVEIVQSLGFSRGVHNFMCERKALGYD